MKKFMWIILCILLPILLLGCQTEQPADIAATTLPVYEFTSLICEGTDLTVEQIITENVSCLHDYTLQVRQMRIIESADAVIISGASLESFLDDVLSHANAVIDTSTNIPLLEEHHGHSHDSGPHHHKEDPHIWLSPENAKIIANNIAEALSAMYPEYHAQFQENLTALLDDLDTLAQYGFDSLSGLSCRELITFHDGFAYFAESFDLSILESVEEESGSEAAASELKDLIQLVESHNLPAIFIESNGSASAAEIISAETDCKIYTLDMAMSGSSYFDAMYHNINMIKEALG